MSDTDDLLAARYALGVAELAEITAAEERLQIDAAFAAKVNEFDILFYGFENASDTELPSPSVWARIEASIDDLGRAPGTYTVRAGDMAWEPFLPGIERKILRIDKEAGLSQVLYRLQPGASVGTHGHRVIEECLVLEGEIEVDGVVARAGDMHLAFPNARHGRVSSRNGAVVYIRGDLQIQA